MADRRTLIRYWRGLNRRLPPHLLPEGEFSAGRNMHSAKGSLNKRSGLDIIAAISTPADDYWCTALPVLKLPRTTVNFTVQSGTSTQTAAGVIND